MQPLHPSLVRWLRRYGPPELLGSLGAVTLAHVAHWVSDSPLVAAYAGTLGENLGFYGLVLWRTWRQERAVARSWRDWGRRARELLLEFGPAEALDSTLLRPLAMGVGQATLGHPWGVLVGKLLADVTFYVPVIVSFEALERRARRSPSGPP